jgi:hypothetical protein
MPPHEWRLFRVFSKARRSRIFRNTVRTVQAVYPEAQHSCMQPVDHPVDTATYPTATGPAGLPSTAPARPTTLEKRKGRGGHAECATGRTASAAQSPVPGTCPYLSPAVQSRQLAEPGGWVSRYRATPWSSGGRPGPIPIPRHGRRALHGALRRGAGGGDRGESRVW